MNLYKKTLIILSVATIFSVYVPQAHASYTDGTIDSTYHSALLCLNDTCTSTSQINFKPTLGTPVHITDSGITGNAWSETFGWINFAPSYGGVTNTLDGVLGGYAWGDGAGWINFAPTHGGVTIGITGQLTGYAWSENFGWIKFNCGEINACVSTDWRPKSARQGPPHSSTITPIITTPVFSLSVVPTTDNYNYVPVVPSNNNTNKAKTDNSTSLNTSVPEPVVFVNPEPQAPPQTTKVSSPSNYINNNTLKSKVNNFWNYFIDILNNFLIKLIGYIEGFVNSIMAHDLMFQYTIFNFSGYFKLSQAILVIFGAAIFVTLVIFVIKKIRRKKKISSVVDEIPM